MTIVGEGIVEEKIVTNPGGRTYPFQTVVELKPVPKEGWVFESWSGDLTGTESPKNITVDKERNVTAKFIRKEYKINYSFIGEGTVEEKIVTNPGGRTYPFQTVVELTPKPKDGWVFESWGGDLTGTESPKNITVDKERNVTLVFRQPIFRLGDNGITCICKNVKPGEKGFINGIEYEVVDNSLLRKRRDEGVDMTKLCTSLVTDMSGLFSQTIFNQPIGNWDVSNVVNMQVMFLLNTRFNQPIGNWDVSKVINMSQMFGNSQFNQPIENWNVGNVLRMDNLFGDSRFNQPLNKWDVRNVKTMEGMFQSTPFNQSIEDWDVGNVENMNWMFRNTPFNHPIGDWDVSNVKKMNNLFQSTPFNQTIGKWNVSKVTEMNAMFAETVFNKPIVDWDVRNVSDMRWMFFNSQFNQNISKWCVEYILSEPTNFSNISPLSSENKPKWGTCPD